MSTKVFLFYFQFSSPKMLGNLKDFISVVQGGLSTNNNLRQTLQEVQKVRNIFREKQRSVNECKVNFGAGGELLEKYQENWAEIHKNADDNAKAADEVDKLIAEVHQLAKSRLRSANDMSHNLAYLPSLTAAVAQCMDSLKSIQELMKTVEDDLVEFEDLVERNKMEKWKLDHHYHLSLYKEKKLCKELGEFQPIFLLVSALPKARNNIQSKIINHCFDTLCLIAMLRYPDFSQ